MTKKCEIHGVELIKGSAPIFYGEPIGPPAGYLDAERTLFPNSFLFMLGGCIISDESKPEIKVNFCPKCREAESAWTGRGPEFKWF
jgi:hypothetical protein